MAEDSKPSKIGLSPFSEFSVEWARSLPESVKAELAQLTTPRMTEYVAQAPTPPQSAFLLLPSEEALYGGAAGGGKSSALLMAALQYVDVPGYAAIIFRRTFSDLALPGALIPRSHEWLAGTDAHWSGDTKTWTFPKSGATLSFGYLEHEDDKYRYQGSELLFCGFDELTQFTESQYRYLFSRLRRGAGMNVPIRMRGASNPGGIGHEWVRRRFLDEGRANGRVFVPALLEDNPYLDREEYDRSLSNLDATTRAQLRYGNWDVRDKGPYFDRSWFGIVDAAPDGIKHWVRFWDMAATEARKGKDPDWTAGALVGVKDGVFYVKDMRRWRESPSVNESNVKAIAAGDGRSVEIGMEQEPGSSGVNVIDHYARHILLGYAFTGSRSTGNKASYAKPVSAAAQNGNVKLVRGDWITEFLDEVEAFPNGAHDDQVDALSRAVARLSPYADRPKVAPPMPPIEEAMWQRELKKIQTEKAREKGWIPPWQG